MTEGEGIREGVETGLAEGVGLSLDKKAVVALKVKKPARPKIIMVTIPAINDFICPI